MKIDAQNANTDVIYFLEKQRKIEKTRATTSKSKIVLRKPPICDIIKENGGVLNGKVKSCL
jgi:hypothetical protein